MEGSNYMLDGSVYWDNWHRKLMQRFPDLRTHFPFAEQVVPLLDTKHAARIIDVCCGQGNDALYFAEAHFEVFAMYISALALKRAQLAAKDMGVTSLHILQADISTPLPFLDGQFGVVYSHLGLHYFD